MIMCVLLCYPVSIHMSQLLSTGRPISSYAFLSLSPSQIKNTQSADTVPVQTMNGAYWRGHMTIGGLPSPHSLTGFLRYLKNVSQRWPVSWMAPTYSTGQEMVSMV